MGVQRLKPQAGGATIKSIQRGTITLPTSGTSGSETSTATISAVDTAKTELRMLGQKNGQDSLRYDAYLELINSTTVRATSYWGTAGHVASFELTEWQQS